VVGHGRLNRLALAERHNLPRVILDQTLCAV
jgi:hypothetical protein